MFFKFEDSDILAADLIIFFRYDIKAEAGRATQRI